MESLPSEVLEDLLLKSAVAIFTESKRVEPLIDITGATIVILMSVCDAWWRALTGRWYQATGRQGNRRMLRREFGARRPYRRLPRCTRVVQGGDAEQGQGQGQSRGHQVQGITELNGRLFIINGSSSVIKVFDATPPHIQFTDIHIPGLCHPRDIVACQDSSRLYVADWSIGNNHQDHHDHHNHHDGRQFLWRVNDPLTSSSSSSSIITEHVPLSLSMTSRRLLVTPYDGTKPLSIHDADGRLSRQVRLPGWMRPLHGVETRRQTIITCNRASTNDDVWLLQLSHILVAEFDLNGNVLAVCGDHCSPQPSPASSASSASSSLIWPCYVVIDKDNGRVLVADRYGQRIVVLNSELHVDRVLLSGLSGQPHRLSFCHHEKQLAIGFYESQGPSLCSIR